MGAERFKAVLPLIPEYGSWLDICKLWEYGETVKDEDFSALMLDLYADELAKSYYAYSLNKEELYQKLHNTAASPGEAKDHENKRRRHSFN